MCVRARAHACMCVRVYQTCKLLTLEESSDILQAQERRVKVISTLLPTFLAQWPVFHREIVAVIMWRYGIVGTLSDPQH